MVANKIAAFPTHFAGPGLEARRPRRTERHIHPPRLDDRRGRRVAVKLVAELRLFDIEDFLVAQNLPALAVQAHDEQFATVLRRRRQPDLIAEDDGRRPGPSVNRRLPLHVV